MGDKYVDKFDEIHQDLEDNVVGITGRSDLMWAIDMCYHSVDRFYFQGRMVEKGMVEILVIGDTRTGKSATVKAMMDHYQRGDFIQGESCTLAGLLGGVDEGGNKNRFVKCGRLPLSHRQLVCIDEANELSEDIVGKMSGVRSSGVFDVVKIVFGRILCRVRMIWIANPRSSKKIGEYSFGVESVPDVIPKPEDIARFDIAVIIGRKDVDRESLYKKTSDKVKCPHRYTSELCHDLIMWAWSRRVDQVDISDESEGRILEWSKMLSEAFDEGIPLIVETEMRIKLARLAVACAARLFSHDGTGEVIVVTPAHVDAVAERLWALYESSSIGYDAWTKQKRSGNLGEEVDDVLLALGRKGMEALLNMKTVSKSILRDLFNDPKAGDLAFQKLMLGKAIMNNGRGFRMTEAMIDKIKVERGSSHYSELPKINRLLKGNHQLEAEM